ncbi:MAG: response regulator transcription factor [Ignavibacteriales bacterium]|nr:response regulator transcription factor [Ignavibacteriales bacterium]MBK7981839.1 response regulator transcription factor [Ignavibacteriota bacterium]
MISTAIIEDIKEIRIPIKEFLCDQEEILCNTSAGSVEEFFENYDKEIPPDVLLLDIGLPGISGLTAIQIIKEKLPKTEIIMLTVHEEAEIIFRALKSGASGYLLKSTKLSEIKNAVIEVSKGGAPMSPLIARKVVKYFDESRSSQNENFLSEREKQVVDFIVDGLSMKMIAANLNVTVDTIKYHCKNIYKKLQINSKGELISKSFRGEI